MKRLRTLVPALTLLLAASACGGHVTVTATDDGESGVAAPAAGDTADAVDDGGGGVDVDGGAAGADGVEAGGGVEAGRESSGADEGGASTPSDERSDSRLELAFAETAAATSGRMQGAITMTGIAELPSGELSMPFSGAFTAAGDSSFVMDLGAMAGAAGDEIPAGMEDMFGTMEMRQIGDTAYVRFPLFSMFFGVETDWLSMPAEQSGDLTGSIAVGSPANPTALLEDFDDVFGQVEDLGAEVVNGIPATHYRVVIDTETLYATATAEQRADLDAKGIPFDEMPLDLWVGDEGMIVRFVMNLEIADPSSGGAMGMVMTYDLFDFGADVRIEEPPAVDVTSADEIVGLEEMLAGG